MHFSLFAALLVAASPDAGSDRTVAMHHALDVVVRLQPALASPVPLPKPHPARASSMISTSSLASSMGSCRLARQTQAPRASPEGSRCRSLALAKT